MSKKRAGCYYCFKTLNPKDEKENLRTFVKCKQCDRIYYDTCWNISGKCVFCGNDQISSVKLSDPPKLQIKVRRQALPIKPSVIYDLKSKSQSEQKVLPPSLAYLAQITRAIILAVFLLVIATFISVFTYRISQLTPITLNTVMEAVFKESPPQTNTFIGAVFSGIVFAFLMYAHSSHPKTSTSNQDSQEAQNSQKTKNVRVSDKKDPFALLIAGIVSIIAFDFIFFNFNPQNIINFNINWLLPHQETLYAQGAIIFLMLLFAPLHKKLAPMTITPNMSRSQTFTNLYGLTRLVFAAVLLNLFVAYLSTYKLPLRINRPALSTIALGHFSFAITMPTIGAFVAGIVTASIFYWPPKCREVKWKLGILRLLLVVACVVVIGFMYRDIASPEGLLSAITIASIAMFVVTPVQYALS